MHRLPTAASGHHVDARASASSRSVARVAAALLFAAAPSLACASGPVGDPRVQPYPAGWPALAGMSSRCTELDGLYGDPIVADRGGAPPRDGIRDGAWAAFDLPIGVVRADDPLVVMRQLALDVRSDGSLDVRYLLDGAEVVRRSFAAAEVSCGAEGLSLTARDRWRHLPPKNTIRGPDTVRTTLYRAGGHLYVRTDATTRTRVLGVVPLRWTSVAWQRHEVDAH
jgi:hypothetical protein